MTVKEKLAVHAGEIEKYLAECLQNRGIPKRLLDAMDYSLLAGGKRLRPVLVLVWGQMLGAKKEALMPFAASLELIHTYSLIHDDLPAMDDDDLRRGKPSNHKMFGEATAILAGDGLLTEAFGLMAKAEAPAENIVEAISLMAYSAGACGMVGGQDVDMDYTGRDDVSLDELKIMHSMKTGALILSACKSGAVLAKGTGATDDDVRRAEEYGRLIGVAFQIVDDVLDVVGDEASLGKPVGSDEEQGKSTYPNLIGLEESKELARKYVDEAVELLSPYSGPEAELLAELAQYIVDRVY
ncbi:polyprenyl synthetase family protein [Maridesulfovibrio frigidus]|uniref:polyprenyl synthetase family protein n=1 Tax=Maridesulfovibrio frigidus TaxID=340956 RepID=UPI0004E14BDE|nr:farnesyl diphosphate synthase [Maridesulfovibrio frigidus]